MLVEERQKEDDTNRKREKEYRKTKLEERMEKCKQREIMRKGNAGKEKNNSIENSTEED